MREDNIWFTFECDGSHYCLIKPDDKRKASIMAHQFGFILFMALEECPHSMNDDGFDIFIRDFWNKKMLNDNFFKPYIHAIDEGDVKDE